MCMSPDQMSDDRIAEAIAYYRQEEALERADGGSAYYAKRWAAKAEDFEALLAERHAARVAEIDEAMAPVTAEAPARETVRV